MFITVKFVFGVDVNGNAWNTIKYRVHVLNVAVPPSALVELSEEIAESTLYIHYLNARSVHIPVYLHLNLKNTCAPIRVIDPMNVNTVLLKVLKNVG